MSSLEIKTWWNTLKSEQMAHEKSKGQQAEKLFLGSLRASRAIKKDQRIFMVPNWFFDQLQPFMA